MSLENRLKVHFTNYKKFVDRTGMIFDSEFLRSMAIPPSAAIGIYCGDLLDELSEFCQKNSEYHVVSQLNANAIVNRPARGAILFFLAKGDPDPRLVYTPTAIASEVFE